MINYNQNRNRNIFSSNCCNPFKLSRSKVQDFLQCPRCFYLDRRCGTSQPPGFPFTLNSAIDALLKKEFDFYRTQGKPHPLMVKHGIDAIPFNHPDLEEWRQNFKGLQVLHKASNLILTGAVDDLWINPAGELIVVDYKATSTSRQISLDEEYRQSYKNQMEIYQWLLRSMGFEVSNTGYFLYCNGNSSKDRFDGYLEFSMEILPYDGNDIWVEPTLIEIRKCLEGDTLPKFTESCNFCRYWMAIKNHIDKGANNV